MLKKIVSGGQTGADRAALDIGMECGLEIVGWIPKGRLAEDGPIPLHYEELVETESSDPSRRTSLNVRDSDATLIVSHGPLSGGSLLTLSEANPRAPRYSPSWGEERTGRPRRWPRWETTR